MRYFFYGTLMDPDVRAWVLGGRVGRRRLAPAVLRGHRRVFLRGRAYPVVVAAPGRAVRGLVADGLDRRAARRLAAFETAEYAARLRPVARADGAVLGARVFLAARRARPTGRDWSLGDWQRLHKREFARRNRAPFALALRVTRRRRGAPPAPGAG